MNTSGRNDELDALIRRAVRDRSKRLNLEAAGYLASAHLKLLAQNLARLGFVEELKLRLTTANGEGATELRELIGMPALRSVSIYAPCPAPENVRHLVSGLTEQSLLTHFEVSGCQINNPGARILGQALGSLPHLRELRVGGGWFDGQGASALLDGLRNNRTLKSLALSGTRLSLSHDDMRWLLDAKEVIRHLESLDLSHSRIYDDDVTTLTTHAATMPELRALVLEGNVIDNDGLLALLRALLVEPWRTSLKQLNLRNTPVEDAWSDPTRRSDDAAGWREFAARRFSAKAAPGHAASDNHARALVVTGVPSDEAQRSLSLEAEVLLETLRRLRDVARSQRNPEHAWRSKSDWFDEAGLNRRRPDGQALIDELVQASFIEARERGEWRQYRALGGKS